MAQEKKQEIRRGEPKLAPWGGIPLLVARLLIEGGVATLSDIIVLAKKEFEGKVRSVEGQSSAVGDLVTITANTGKDMYLARAVVTFYQNAGGTATADQVELKLNGVIKETARYSGAVNANGAGFGGNAYEFKNIGQKVAAGQIIKLEIIGLDADTDCEGMIEVFEEDSGTDPFEDFT